MAWFKEHEETPRAEKKQEPIKDYAELISHFKDTRNRVQNITNQAYENFLPVVERLLGTGKGADDIGDIGRLRSTLQYSGFLRTDAGRLIWSVLRDIEDLSMWLTKYSNQLEQYIDALMFECESAFVQIDIVYDQLEKMEVDISRLQESFGPKQVPTQEQINEINARPPLTDEGIRVFSELFRERFLDYRKFHLEGNRMQMRLAKGRCFILARKDDDKKAVAEALWNELMDELNKETHNKISSKNEGVEITETSQKQLDEKPMKETEEEKNGKETDDDGVDGEDGQDDSPDTMS